jgi:hypothetical protein
VSSPGARDPAVPPAAKSRPPGPAPTVADISTPAAASTAGVSQHPAAAGRFCARRSRLLGAGQLIVLVGGLVFIVSVTLLSHYANNGNGWKSFVAGDPR